MIALRNSKIEHHIYIIVIGHLLSQNANNQGWKYRFVMSNSYCNRYFYSIECKVILIR